MKTFSLLSFALVASVATLCTTAAFAVDNASPGVIKSYTDATVSNVGQLNPLLDGKTAVSLQPGQALPILDIHEGGEVTVSDNNVIKTPWSSTSFENKGKVQFVQYVSANRGAARQNKSFTNALIERRFSSDQLNTTVIVNLSDTMSLLKGIVVNKVARNKVKHQSISFVIDDDGMGLQRWGMKNESCAIIILDADGKVLFAKDGQLSEHEVESTMELIESQLS